MNKLYKNKVTAIAIILLTCASLYACTPTAIIDIQGYLHGDREVEIQVGEPLTFEGDRSHDNDENGQLISSHYWYVWKVSVGEPEPIYNNYDYYTNSGNKTKEIPFNSPGVYKVKLQVRDDEGYLSAYYEGTLNTCTITVTDGSSGPDPIIVNNGLPEVQVDGNVIFNGTVSYDSEKTPQMKVYYGISDGSWEGDTGWITTVNGEGEFSSGEISGFSPGTLYFFRSYGEYTDASDEDWDETTTHNNPNPIKFMTAPGQAGNPSPGIGREDAGKSVLLQWDGDASATEHRVYFGETQSAVGCADENTSGIYRNGHADTFYLVPEILDIGEDYFWRIDEVLYDSHNGNVARVRKGTVWSFTVDPQYHLIVNSIGTYSIDPPEGPYGYGTPVTVLADPITGYDFEGWSGDQSGGNLTLEFVIYNDTTIYANYQIQRFPLNVSTTGGPGTVDCKPTSGDGEYNYGTVVFLTARSDPGYRFKQWTGDLTGTENPETVFIDDEKSVAAEFERAGYVLTMSASEGGTASPSCGEHIYPEGTEVTVRAYSAEGYEFTGWTGEAADLLSSASSSTATLTMDNNDHWLTANFVAVDPVYTLNISSDESGTTDPSPGSHQYSPDSVPLITATPPGSFIRWEGTAVDAGKVSDPFQNVINDLQLDDNYTLHAVFEYKLDISRNCEGGTVVSPGLGVYRKVRTEPAGIIDIQAVPNDGYVFTEWEGSAVSEGAVADYQSPITTVTMVDDYTITADFAVGQYNLIISAGSNGSVISHEVGNPYTYGYGTVVPIEAQPEAGYHFKCWCWTGTSDVAEKVTNPYSPNTTILMEGKALAVNSDYQITATFEEDIYVVDILPSAGGATTPDSDTNLNSQDGLTQTVTAISDVNYRFVEWKGTAIAAGKVQIQDAENPHIATVTVDGNYTLRAVFEPLEPIIVYVSLDGSDNNSGLSWDDAFATLQKALDWAEMYAVDQIWVAAGTYYPSEEQDPGDPRSASFVLVEDVELYGGFAGDETALSARDIAANPTILSGDIDGNDNGWSPGTENAYHVVTGAADSFIDGFTIVGGVADGPDNLGGGGILADNLTGVLFVRNCIIKNNNAGDTHHGGGLYSIYSTISLINCLFSGNASAKFNTTQIDFGYGGAVYAKNSEITVINNTLSDNLSGRGGGVYIDAGGLFVKNSILWGNVVEQAHNAFYGEQIYDINSSALVTVEHCCIQAYDASDHPGWTVSDNISVNPLFVMPGSWEGISLPGSISLTATVRDLKGSTLEGGHPDFEYANGFETGIVQQELDDNKKPIYAHGEEGTTTTHGETLFYAWFNDDPLNQSMPLTLTLCPTGAVGEYEFVDETFYPIDGKLWDIDESNQIYNDGGRPCQNCGTGDVTYHNYHFTTELHTSFVYDSSRDQNFKLYKADDDLFIFIDGTLVIDLGGVHSPRSKYIKINDSGDIEYYSSEALDANGTIPPDDTLSLGLDDGVKYDFDLFFAERHTDWSHLQFTTTLKLETNYTPGDYHLLAGSPCLDAGDNGVVPGDVPVDLDGLSRFVNDPDTPDDNGHGTAPIVDMGAYEFQVENTPPIAEDDTFEMIFGQTLYITPDELLQNDVDADFDALYFHSIVNPPDGDFAFDAVNHQYEYTPISIGQDTFTYKIYDGIAASYEATVKINVREIGPLTVNAGTPQTVTLVDDGSGQGIAEAILYNATITGDRVDNPGATNINKSWTASYVPPSGSVVLDDDTALHPTATLTLSDPDVFAYMESVQFELKLHGADSTRQGEDTVVITVLPSSGFQAAPQVDAGAYDPRSWPDENSVFLDGTVTDDGLPAGVLYYHWTVTEANGGDVIFEDEFSEDTTATFTGQGRYTLRLSATDTQATGYDETVVIVRTPPVHFNQPPTVRIVDAEENDVEIIDDITLNNEPFLYTFYLDANDDGNIEPLTYTWSLVTTPDTPVDGIQLTDVHSSQPTASFAKEGTYWIQVEAYDGQYSAYDTVAVTIYDNPNPVTFTVDAGADKEIQLPAMAHLIGNYDPYPFEQGDPNDLDFHWYLLDGPARVKFVNDSDQQLYAKAEFTEPGEYIFRIEGSYNNILSDVDDVIVKVNPLIKIVDSSGAHTLLIDDSINAGLWSFGSNVMGALGRPIIVLDDDLVIYEDGIPRIGIEAIENAEMMWPYYMKPVFPADQIDPTYPVSVLPSNQIFEFHPDYTEHSGQFNKAIDISATLSSSSKCVDAYGHVWRWGDTHWTSSWEGWSKYLPRDVFPDDLPYDDLQHPYRAYYFTHVCSTGGCERKFAAPLPIICGDQQTISGLLENIVAIEDNYRFLSTCAVESNGSVWEWDVYDKFGPACLYNNTTNTPLANIIEVAGCYGFYFLEEYNIEGKIYYIQEPYVLNPTGYYVPSPDYDYDGISDSETYGSIYLENIVDISASWSYEEGISDIGMALEAIDDSKNCYGHVYVWDHYALGNVLYGNVNVNNNGSAVPVLVQGGEQGSDYLTNIVDIALSEHHALALEAINQDGLYGYVYTWGWNYFGELGTGNLSEQTTPVKVLAPDLDSDGNSDPEEYGHDYLKDIIAVYSGRWNSFAVDKDGRLFAWGSNIGGSLGLGVSYYDLSHVSVPREVPCQKRVHNIDSGVWYYQIQDAIEDDNTVDGDHIVVLPGIYYEDIDLLDKNIILTSEDPTDFDIVSKTIIRGGIAINDSVDDLTSMVSGFTIIGDGAAGIIITGTDTSPIDDTIYLTNNIIKDCEKGIQIDRANFVYILNNQIVENSAGIDISNSNTIIRNNTITANTNNGISVSSADPELVNNIIWGNGTGNTLSNNISDISNYIFCCIGGLGEPYSNGNFNADPDFGDNYSLNSGSPCINTGFTDTVLGGGTTSVQPGNINLYSNGDIIEINNDRIPRTVTGIAAGQIQFVDDPLGSPAQEGMQITNWHCIEHYTDITCAEGSDNTFVIQDPSLYDVGDTVKTENGDFVNVVSVHPEGRIIFTPQLSTSTTEGTTLTVWKLSDIDGNPRVAGGVVDIGADEYDYWKVDAGEDQTVTVNQPCETADASMEYTGLSDLSGYGVAVQWSVLDPPDTTTVTFGNDKLIGDTLHTCVDFDNNVNEYELQLTIFENNLPVAWDTMKVNVMYDISYTSDPTPPIVTFPADPINFNLIIDGSGDPYDVEWNGPTNGWFGRGVEITGEGDMTDVDVDLEGPGYYPLTVELIDQASGNLTGKTTIGVTGKAQFTNVIIEPDAEEIVLPDNSIHFDGHVEGILGEYLPEWKVLSGGQDKAVTIIDSGSWSTDIVFDKPGSYEAYLIVRESKTVAGLELPLSTIVGTATATIEVKPSAVDAGPDQTIIWPQNFAYLFGQVTGTETYSCTWSPDPENPRTVTFVEDNDTKLNPTVTFPGSGWYKLILSASDGGEDLGSDSVNIFVNNPTLNVEAGDDKTGYIGEYITLSDLNTTVPSECTYYWITLSENGTIIDSDLETAAIRFTEAGKYQVYLIAEIADPYQFGSDSLFVTVSSKGGISNIEHDPGNPVEFVDRGSILMTAILNTEVYPEGLPINVSAQWISDDTVEFQPDPADPENPLKMIVSFPGPGLYQVGLELIENDIYIDYAATTVYVSPPLISVDAKVENQDEYVAIFDGTPIELDFSGNQIPVMDGFTYTWTLTGGDPVNVSELPSELSGDTVTFNGSGIYMVTLRALSGEVIVAKDDVTVVLQSPEGEPFVNAGGIYPVAVVGVPFHLNKARICDTEPIILTEIDWSCNPTGVTWAPDPVEIQNPFITFPSEGKYDVTLAYTDADDNVASDTASIYVQPNYQVYAGSTELTYPFTNLKMKDAKVMPKSSQYSYEWICSPSNAKVKFNPDCFCLNPTIQFKEVGDYTLTLNVSRGDQYIGSSLVTIQVRPNPHVDEENPEIIDFKATYDNGTGVQTDIQDESAVHGDIQITAEARDDNIDRIELSLYETADPSNKQVIQGGVCTIEAGTHGNPTVLLLEHTLDTYLSGAVTLKVRAIDRAGNVTEAMKTFTSTHTIAAFTVNKEIFESTSDTIEFNGALNEDISWTIDIVETEGSVSGSGEPVYASGVLNSSDFDVHNDGGYTALLTAGDDTATVTFDVIVSGINNDDLYVSIDPALHVEVEEDTQIPVSAIPTIQEGIYKLYGSAYHDATNSVLNELIRYKLVLTNDTGFSKNITPGILDAQNYCHNYVIPGDPEHGSFGELDFSDVPNGVYTLTLTVKCLEITKTDVVDLNISTPLKVGHVKFSQEDISVNIGGYPIQVIRTYDGLNRKKQGDFGFGWVYSLSNLDIEVTKTGPFNRDVTITLPDGMRTTFASYLYGQNSSITAECQWDLKYNIPDGLGVASFETYPETETLYYRYWDVGYYWKYSYYHMPSGGYPWSGELFDIVKQDPSGFKLTMDDGTIYTISRSGEKQDVIGYADAFDYMTGETTVLYSYWAAGKPYLSSIDLPTGEIIVFEFDSVTSTFDNPIIKKIWQFPASIHDFDNDGIADDPDDIAEIENLKQNPSDPSYSQYATGAIEISHDDVGRITAIYPPSELEQADPIPYVRYHYDDGYGNLTAVDRLKTRGSTEEDSEYDTTTYEYEDTVYDPSDHYVTAIKDARGLAPIRYEYDGEGRLIATIDAKGNRIKIQHDVLGDQKMETVTDRCGNITDYIYNSWGNVETVNKYDSQGFFLTQTKYKYEDTSNPDSPTEIGSHANYDDLENLTYPDDYNVNKTVYIDGGKTRLTIDPKWNITYYNYVGENLTETTQLEWTDSENEPDLPDYSMLASVTSPITPDELESCGYKQVLTTCNTYYAPGDLLKTTETRDTYTVAGDTKWYSMSITLYDDRNRVTHSIQVDAEGIDSTTIANFRKVDSVADDGDGDPDDDLVNLLGNHVVTSYWYNQTLSGSSDQPYSISEQHSPDQTPVYHQFFYYDLNNRQAASWQAWNDPTNGVGYDARVLVINELDAQGRNKRSVQVTEYYENVETLDVPEFNTIFADIDDYIDGKEAVIQNKTEYNKIGKVWTSEGQHLPGEEGTLAVYAYDEVGQLVETRTYAGKSDYSPTSPNSNVLTISRTLYDAEGRTLVSVGPYAIGDEPVGTENFYDDLGRVVETVRWADVEIPLVNLYGAGNEIVGLRLPSAAKPANAWSGSQTRPDNIGWTANGTLPTIGEELSYSRTVYDAAGRVQMSIALDEDGYEQPTSYEYDAAGRQTAVIDPQGHTLSHEQIGNWYVITAAPLNSTHRSETHYNGTRRDYVVDAAGNATFFTYDALGRVITTQHPDSIVEEGGANPVPTYTHVGYDGLGRKIWETTGPTTESYATVESNLDTMARQYVYDTTGRLIQVILPEVPDPENSNTPTSPIYDYFYDNYGNMTGQLDPKHRLTVLKYDYHNRQTDKYMPFAIDSTQYSALMAGTTDIYTLLAAESPTSTCEQTFYDDYGRIDHEMDYKQQVVEYQYDAQGRLEYKYYYEADGDLDGDNENYLSSSYAEYEYYSYDALGRQETVSDGTNITTYTYDNEGRIRSVAGPEGTINYEYNSITGQKVRTYTSNTDTDYVYDNLGRLAEVSTVAETTYYGYDEVGNRKWQCIDATGDFVYDPVNPTGYEIKTDYTYNALNRLTDLVQQKAGPTQLATYNYTVKANGHRCNLSESLHEDRNIAYGYDNLNRLTDEIADASGDGYDIDYIYGLVGNRIQRTVNVNDQTLVTDYVYDPDTDRLLKETHTGPVYAFVQGDEKYYAYANPSGGIHYQRSGSEQQIGQFRAFWMGLPSVWNSVLFYVAMILIPVVAFWPVLVRQWSRIRGHHNPLDSADLKLWHRILCVLLAYIFLIGPEAFHVLAHAQVQYANLNSASWGQGNRDIHYTYDENGSLTEKTTAVKDEPDPQMNYEEKITYTYNLQNRLAQIVREYEEVGDTIEQFTEYNYNHEGIRVSKHIWSKINDTHQNDDVTVVYLVDAYNHTGYAQVLEEITFNDAAPDPLTDTPDSLTTYTIGDDVIAQNVDGTIDYLLYDGHSSTRQLANWTGSDVSVSDHYSYDGYGVLLQDDTVASNNPGRTLAQVTNLLYAGEQFDTDAQQYYLRARYYNPLNGIFNRTDPYSGNTQDPQSLHKYLYCHNNPLNAIDPGGAFSILDVTMTISTIASITSVFVPRIMGIYRSAKKLLDLTDFAQLLRRLANQGIIDLMLAEQMRIEASRMAISLIGRIGSQIIDIVKEAVSYYAYGLLFAGVTSVAMGGVSAGVRMAKSARVSIEVGDEIVKHHLVFKCAVKPNVRQSLWRLPRSAHVSPNGLHSRISRNERFWKLQPRKGMKMESIIRGMGRQKWLDELGECYKWLETDYPGQYKGIHEAYQKAVGQIGGASGLI